MRILFLIIILGTLGLVVLAQSSPPEGFAFFERLLSRVNFSSNTDQRSGDAKFEKIDLDFNEEDIDRRFPNLSEWQRPDGPLRVGLQVGHWRTEELPDEFERLRRRGGGTRGGGKKEWEVNLAIAEKTANLLRDQGIVVDILPATVPEAYWADAFIAIHADGNDNSSVSGFKVASAYDCSLTGRRQVHSEAHSGMHSRDHGIQQEGTGESGSHQWPLHFYGGCVQSNDTGSPRLVELLETEYQQATDLSLDRNVTHNMRGYYAFNWRRYEHAVHPMTTAVILEAGFLTSPHDRAILIGDSRRAAEGIAKAVTQFLNEQDLL